MDILTSSNYNKIEELVENYFSLNSNSLKRFKENLYNPDIDDVYKKLISKEDFRFKINLSDEDMLEFDEGWKNFKKIFKTFVNENNILYSDFINGTMMKNKNLIKLSKELAEFYSENEPSYISDLDHGWRYFIEGERDTYEKKRKAIIKENVMSWYKEVSSRKFSGKASEISLVLSLNFADWFLCSTGENWTSCLNLESDYHGAYWTGLPGTIVDKNRALLYLTDGRTKNYLDIKTDRILKRSWVIIDKDNVLNIIRFFPSEISTDLIRKKFGNDWNYLPENEKRFVSKHGVEFLRYTSGDSCFIYQDHTVLNQHNKKYHFVGSVGNGGYYCLDKSGNLAGRNIFSLTSGLNYIVEKNKNISKYLLKNIKKCAYCDGEIIDDDFIIHDGHYYCEDCYSEHFYECSGCGLTFFENATYAVNYESWCRSCFRERFFCCDGCHENLPLEEKIEVGNHKVCKNCYELYFATCDVCGETFQKSIMRITSDDKLCFKCYSKKELQQNQENDIIGHNEY